MNKQQIVNSIRDGIAHLKMLGPIQGAYAFGKLADKIQHELDTEPQLEICAYNPRSSCDPNWNSRPGGTAVCLVVTVGDMLITEGYWPGTRKYIELLHACNNKPKWLYGQTPIEL
jgi:hypothetical protein